jgi:hypothetical protein
MFYELPLLSIVSLEFSIQVGSLPGTSRSVGEHHVGETNHFCCVHNTRECNKQLFGTDVQFPERMVPICNGLEWHSGMSAGHNENIDPSFRATLPPTQIS